MGCLSSMARLFLILVNIVFLLLGLALFVVGLIIRFGRTLYDPFLKVATDQLKDALAGTNLGSFDVTSIDIGEILQGLAIGLIIGGLILCIIAFSGCCGACCKSTILLWLYAIILIVFFVGEAVAIGLLYGKPDLVKDNVKKSVKDFKGLGSSDVISVAWNIVMIQFECCGVNGYQDFIDLASGWDRTPGGNLQTPVACCKTLPTTPTFTCANSPITDVLSNGNHGCYDAIWDLSFGNSAIVIPVLVVCGLIQLAFIIFAIYIAKQEESGKVSPI